MGITAEETTPVYNTTQQLNPLFKTYSQRQPDIWEKSTPWKRTKTSKERQHGKQRKLEKNPVSILVEIWEDNVSVKYASTLKKDRSKTQKWFLEIKIWLP